MVKHKLDGNFYLLLIGRLVSQLGDAFFSISIAWYILDMSGSSIHMSLYLALGTTVYIISSLFLGNLADRYNKVKLMYWMDYLRGFGIIFASATVFMKLPNQWIMSVLFLNTILLNVCASIFNPSTTALLKKLVQPQSLKKANAYLASTAHLATIIGLVYGSIIYDKFGIFIVLLINGLSFVVSGVSEMFIKYQEQEEDNKKEALLTMLRKGVAYIATHQLLLFIMAFAAVWNFIYTPIYFVYIPVLFKTVVRSQASYLGGVQAALSFGLLSGTFVAYKIKTKHMIGLISRVVFIQLILFSFLPLILNGYNHQRITEQTLFVLYSICLFIIGILICIVNINISVILQQRASHAYIGRVSALHSTMCTIAMPLGMVLGGLISEKVVLLHAFIIQIGLFTLLTLVVMVVHKYFKEDAIEGVSLNVK